MSFSEDDIRPSDLEEGKIEELNLDLERLRSFKKDFVEVSCPACEKEDSIHEFKKFGFNFQKCHFCNTVYMTPRATSKILGEFYSGSKLYVYWDKYILFVFTFY